MCQLCACSVGLAARALDRPHALLAPPPLCAQAVQSTIAYVEAPKKAPGEIIKYSKEFLLKFMEVRMRAHAKRVLVARSLSSRAGPAKAGAWALRGGR